MSPKRIDELVLILSVALLSMAAVVVFAYRKRQLLTTWIDSLGRYFSPDHSLAAT